MKKFLNILSVSIAMMIGMGAIVSCEDETLNLGNGVVGGDAEGNVKTLDVIAYNDNFDTLRTDKFVLKNGAFGAYNESIFGTTSSKFYTQLRPSAIGNADFGTETQIDSVNLYIPVYYNASKDPISKDTINLSKPGEKATDNDTILITTKYAVDSLYGKKDLNMTLRVRDINTVLYNNSKYFSKLDGSESLFSVNSPIIGTAKIGKTVENKVVKLRSASANIFQETIGYKVTLDKQYFDDKIIKNAKTGLLSDYATFIRENIRGFEFSVDETDGFIVNFNPNGISLNMHYSYKNPTDKTDGQTNYQERLSGTYGFDFTNLWNSATANNSNVIASQITNNYTGSTYENILNSVNTTEGDARIYLNGMSGSHAKLRINQQQLDSLKTDITSKNVIIVGAKLKFFIDEKASLPKPPYIVAWNEYTKDGKAISELYADVLEFYNAYPNSVHFNPIVTGDTDFYTIDITKHLKSMLEKENSFQDQTMLITLGNFVTSVADPTTINSTNPYQNNRAFNPYRVVLHGNNSEIDAKKLKLLVYYSQK